MLSRQRVAEMMDDPNLDQHLHVEALRGLQKLNSLSGSADLLCREISKVSPMRDQQRVRILDIATGGGDVLLSLTKRLPNERFEFTGVDISPIALAYTGKQARSINTDISLLQCDALHDSIPGEYDVVMTSLFTHHLDPPDVVKLLGKMKSACTQMVLVNDLIRSRLALGLVWLASRSFTRSPIVHFDGPASVRAAYTPGELEELAHRAGLTDCKIRTQLPCRQLLVWRRPK